MALTWPSGELRRVDWPVTWQLVRALAETDVDVIFLDYDGTLTPIVARPEEAHLDGRMRDVRVSVGEPYFNKMAVPGGLAILFLMVGFGFKISAVPFHFWAPDTYEGAPTPITAYLSVNSKAAGFVAMLIVMYQALPDASDIWAPALWLLAALSMTIGNLSALRQTNIVRLLAYWRQLADPEGADVATRVLRVHIHLARRRPHG